MRIRLECGKSVGLYGVFMGWVDDYIVVIVVILSNFIYAWCTSRGLPGICDIVRRTDYLQAATKLSRLSSFAALSPPGYEMF